MLNNIPFLSERKLRAILAGLVMGLLLAAAAFTTQAPAANTVAITDHVVEDFLADSRQNSIKDELQQQLGWTAWSG